MKYWLYTSAVLLGTGITIGFVGAFNEVTPNKVLWGMNVVEILILSGLSIMAILTWTFCIKESKKREGHEKGGSS